MMSSQYPCDLLSNFLFSEYQLSSKKHQIDTRLKHMNILTYLYVSTSYQFGINLVSIDTNFVKRLASNQFDVNLTSNLLFLTFQMYIGSYIQLN